MLAGELYCYSGSRELLEGLRRARYLTRLYNATGEEEEEKRLRILRELFASVGESCVIEPDFRCDYGSNIWIGDDFYANFGCVILDVCPVRIGSHVLLGPGVHIYTAAHPVAPDVRQAGLEYGRPVTIADGVWIGGGAILNPGVTIGPGTVVGAGSVVTKDLPGGVVAAGNPCRVLREIAAEERQMWREKQREYLEWASRE